MKSQNALHSNSSIVHSKSPSTPISFYHSFLLLQNNITPN